MKPDFEEWYDEPRTDGGFLVIGLPVALVLSAMGWGAIYAAVTWAESLPSGALAKIGAGLLLLAGSVLGFYALLEMELSDRRERERL